MTVEMLIRILEEFSANSKVKIISNNRYNNISISYEEDYDVVAFSEGRV